MRRLGHESDYDFGYRSGQNDVWRIVGQWLGERGIRVDDDLRASKAFVEAYEWGTARRKRDRVLFRLGRWAWRCVKKFVGRRFCIWLDSPDGNSTRTLTFITRPSKNAYKGIDICSWKPGERERLERFFGNVFYVYPEY